VKENHESTTIGRSYQKNARSMPSPNLKCKLCTQYINSRSYISYYNQWAETTTNLWVFSHYTV